MDEVTSALLRRLRDDLFQVEQDWSADAEDGFDHWPNRLAQRISVAGDSQHARWQAITDVVVELSDPAAAVAACNQLNALTGGWAYVFDPDSGSITARTTMVGPAEWEQQWSRWVNSALLSFRHADSVADALAEAVGGLVAESWPEHQNAPRQVPDEMWSFIDHTRARPEWVFSPAVAHLFDMREPLRLLTDQMESMVRDSEAFQGGFTVTGGYDADGPVVYELTGRITHRTWLGIGFEAEARFPPVGDQPNGLAAAGLNWSMATNPDRPLSGSWHQTEDALLFSVFVPAFALGYLMSLPSARREPPMVLVNVAAPLAHAVFTAPEAWDDSSGHSPSHKATISQGRADVDISAALIADAAAAILEDDDAEQADMRLLGVEDFSDTLVTWGIFNPYGPTLTTIHLTQPTDDGTHYLVRLQRHPFSPDYRVVGPLERDRLAEELSGLVESTLGSPPEFVDLDSCPDELASLVASVLRRAVNDRAREYDDDLVGSAMLLNHYAGGAWERMHHTPEIELPPRPDLEASDTADFWWAAVTDPANVAGHLMAFPSAWDGAIEFLHSTATHTHDEE